MWLLQSKLIFEKWTYMCSTIEVEQKKKMLRPPLLPKTLKMEHTAVVRDAQHKQLSRENKPVSHNSMEKRTWPASDLNQYDGNWAVRLQLTNKFSGV